MCFRCSSVCALLILIAGGAAAGDGVLRVCSDPDNLPFSNRAEQGFENRLAEVVARGLNRKLEYMWLPQQKSFVEKSLDANACDLLIGIPAELDSVSATHPYYRSTYVMLSRRERDLKLSSLSDPRFSEWRIGIHVVGDGYAPPAYALTRRGLAANLVAFSLTPAAKLLDAVARGEVDVAIAWGPPAGYYAKESAEKLDVVPVSPSMFMGVPFTFDIAMGVRKGDEEFRERIDRVLTGQCAAVEKVLTEYGVPQLKKEDAQCDGSSSPRSASLH